MNPIYFLLIPACISTAWVLYTKYQQRKFTDLIILTLNAVAVMTNVLLVYDMIAGNLTIGWRIVQMTAATIIIPLCYTYFALQVGRQTINSAATLMLWVLALLSFIPNIYIYNPFEPFVMPKESTEPFALCVVSHGQKVFSMYNNDLTAMLQCLVALLRIIPLMIMLRKFNLHLNKKVYAFGSAWLLIIVFVCMVSSMSMEEICSPFGKWFYFVSYTLLIILVNALIGLRYDLFPVETEQGDAVEDLSLYVQEQYSGLATRLRSVMKEQKLYTNPQLSAETVVELLGTNHTYFSQMMSSELGMSFSEYVNSLRLAQVERLLRDDSLTIANVAQQSGFSDAGYMSRKFKAKHGITPSEWRKR